MGRLIDEARDILDKWEFFYGQRAGRELWAVKPVEVQNQDIENFNRDIQIVRTALADAVPVAHGEWVKSESMPRSARCSVCGCWVTRHSVSENWFRYCPHCGADMREEK